MKILYIIIALLFIVILFLVIFFLTQGPLTQGLTAQDSLTKDSSKKDKVIEIETTIEPKFTISPTKNQTQIKNPKKILNQTTKPNQVSQIKNIDCKVGNWSDWGPCTKTCGGGTQEKTRNITTQPQGNGKACPELKETRECNTEPCSFVKKSNKVRSVNECNNLLDDSGKFYTNDCKNPYKSVNYNTCVTQACSAGTHFNNWDSAQPNVLACDYIYNDTRQKRNIDNLKNYCNSVIQKNLEITEGIDDIKDCINDYCPILVNSGNCKDFMNNSTKYESEKNCSIRCFCSQLQERNDDVKTANIECITNYTKDDCNL